MVRMTWAEATRRVVDLDGEILSSVKTVLDLLLCPLLCVLSYAMPCHLL